MKKIFVAASLLLSFTSFAQVPQKLKPLDFLKKYYPDLKMNGQLYAAANIPGLSYPKATFAGINAFGKIYTLPQDNMPCLVPDINLVKAIPITGMNIQNSQMPNPYKKEEIIPVQ